MFMSLQNYSAGVPKSKKKTILSIQRPINPFCPTAVCCLVGQTSTRSREASLQRLIGTRWGGNPVWEKQPQPRGS